MNLVSDSWIPTVTSRNVAKVSLQQVFSTEDLGDLDVTPVERIALIRFLCCIAHVSLLDANITPNPSKWTQSEKEQLTAAVQTYLTKHYSKFQMDGPNSFMQPNVKVYKDKKTKSEDTDDTKPPLNKIIFHRAIGNNGTLFDKSGYSEQLTWDVYARWLLTTLNYNVGGTIGRGILSDGDTPTSKHSRPSPCTGSSPSIHVVVLGATLLETIWKNLLTTEEWKALSPSKIWKKSIGRPIWEKMPDSTAEEVQYTESYLQRLCPLSRFIRIDWESNKCILTNGFYYSTTDSEPSITLIKNSSENIKKGKPLHFRLGLPDAAIWRELGTLLEHKAPVITHHEPTQDITLWCGGMIFDNANVSKYVEWQGTLPNELITNEPKRIELQRHIQLLGILLNNIAKAYSDYRKAINNKKQPKVPVVKFWYEVEHVFPLLAWEIAQNIPLSERKWGRRVFDIAERFITDLPSNSARKLAARTKVHQIYTRQAKTLWKKIHS